ncbi:MAG TPA: DNA adenine methylase [Nitrospirae bacterium]|nr:DNA adenine methylase [Nitrospirota bacterium]HDK80991.1 DNA adenine methylase [Nitrospirota bacterium]HDO25313.1 DNA adenine methylase [Nitrospirota bacterium]
MLLPTAGETVESSLTEAACHCGYEGGVVVNSFIAWVGGKRILAKKIISVLPEHNCYVEVFGGAGWVLFRKQQSNVEVL